MFPNIKGFRPLIRGFFFYLNGNAYTFYAFDSVSVPSFGDSFFIMYTDKRCDPRKMRFPSPHSGILFLSAVILEESAEEKESFRPLIRGFFFYNK